MSNLAHIIETAVLLALAYGVGAVLGFLMRRLWHGTRAGRTTEPTGEPRLETEGIAKVGVTAAVTASPDLAQTPAMIASPEAEPPGAAVPRLPARSVGSLFGSIEEDLADERVIADDDARLEISAPSESEQPRSTAQTSPVDQLLAELGRDAEISPALQRLEPASEVEPQSLQPVMSGLGEAEPVILTRDEGSLLELVASPQEEEEQTASSFIEDDERAAMHAVEGTAPRRRRLG